MKLTAATAGLIGQEWDPIKEIGLANKRARAWLIEHPSPWELGSSADRKSLLPAYEEIVEPIFANSTGDGSLPLDWDWRAYLVKHRAKWTCANCNRTRSEAEEFMHAHHIEGRLERCTDMAQGPHGLENLECLCERCHKKIHPHMEP